MARKLTEGLIDDGSARAICAGAHGDPFAVLGIQDRGKRLVLTAFVPGADSLVALFGKTEIALPAIAGHPGLFAAEVKARAPYRLRASNSGASWEFDDPFRFGPVIGELDEYLLGQSLIEVSEYMENNWGTKIEPERKTSGEYQSKATEVS